MTGIYNSRRQGAIRLCATHGLIFFVFGLLVACHQPSESNAITVRWDSGRATGIFIPRLLIESTPADSIDRILSVRLMGKEVNILGNYRRVDDGIFFEPLVPLTRGLRYGVWLRNKRLSIISIPALPNSDRPTLLAIYPSQDSLPDNLLKIYLHFSRPMREGQSKQYVSMLKNDADTLPGVFLDLQPELWNADRTVLTLWLDPGRIKRDLQPNKLLGSPLQIGTHYRVVVSGGWPDEQGATLDRVTTKPFLTVRRDSLSPAPVQWTVSQPKPGSGQPLEVAFGEALDYGLLTETLYVFDEAGKPVLGTWQRSDEEKRGRFKPVAAWKTGQYRLQIDSRLEDLAGNNLNRPFDRNITRSGITRRSQAFAELFFRVR